MIWLYKPIQQARYLLESCGEVRQNGLKRDGGRGDIQFEDHGGKRKDRLPVE